MWLSCLILVPGSNPPAVGEHLPLRGFRKGWSKEGFACVSRDGSRVSLCQGDQGQSGTGLWVGVYEANRMYADCAEKGATIHREIVNNLWVGSLPSLTPTATYLALSIRRASSRFAEPQPSRGRAQDGPPVRRPSG
jgi:hypothetical protein